jgi:hypothetical protein
MGRHGYSDDGDWDTALYIAQCGAVKKAIEGFRGQAFLQELRRALDAMPKKELIHGELVEGENVCALGAIGLARGTNLQPVQDFIAHEKAEYGDDWDYCGDLEYIHDKLAELLDITPTLAREVMYANDEGAGYLPSSAEPPDRRWQRMRNWVERHILPENR